MTKKKTSTQMHLQELKRRRAKLIQAKTTLRQQKTELSATIRSSTRKLMSVLRGLDDVKSRLDRNQAKQRTLKVEQLQKSGELVDLTLSVSQLTELLEALGTDDTTSNAYVLEGVRQVLREILESKSGLDLLK